MIVQGPPLVQLEPPRATDLDPRAQAQAQAAVNAAAAAVADAAVVAQRTAADRERMLRAGTLSNVPPASRFRARLPESPMHLTLEVDREEDGRWLAEVPDLAGVLAYGETRDEAIARAEALALRVLADRLDHGEAGPDLVTVSFRAA